MSKAHIFQRLVAEVAREPDSNPASGRMNGENFPNLAARPKGHQFFQLGLFFPKASPMLGFSFSR